MYTDRCSYGVTVEFGLSLQNILVIIEPLSPDADPYGYGVQGGDYLESFLL